MIMISLTVDGVNKEYPQGTTYEIIAQEFQTADRPLIAAVKENNKLRQLMVPIKDKANVELIDLSMNDGMRIYQRSLSFVFIRAVMELFEETNVIVKHSLSQGLYCEFLGKHRLINRDLSLISQKMTAIIESNELFVEGLISVSEAIEIFERYQMNSKLNLLKYREKDTLKIYTLGWLKDYFYGYMLPSTGYLKEFDLVYYKPGVILRHPVENSPYSVPKFNEHKKLFEIHSEAEKWGEILNVGYVANLNCKIENGLADEFIKISEALHEKKIAMIADMITNQKKRVILIAGPSSSGKTTFANRLKIQLRANGLRPVNLSTDDYFVERERTPLDEKGNYDFDSIEALDIESFNKDLKDILDGEKVDLPTFNFQTGHREFNGKVIQIDEDQIVIIEGIHGLNEKLTGDLLKKDKFKIYISALTQLNIDSHNRIPTTDIRIIRRIVRDNNFRGHSALKTLQMWKSVRKGEEKNIFPYQEDADVMFNSALVYEMAILKKHAVPLLEDITQDNTEYSEARRLLKFLSYFVSIDNDELVPRTSILKEFIGGSSFDV
ncbi:MAG: nucleoside kinase [Clostridiales bacterium]|nr:nucleoside kinase [Clostridiales bacterium]